MSEITLNDLSFAAIKIVSRLARFTDLSYTQARPDDLDNNLYKYHLDFLQQKGIVAKTGSSYALTEFGKNLAQSLSLESGIVGQFKVSVICYVYDTTKSPALILMHKRHRHPYFGDIETVAGKVRRGESIEQAAASKLQEEAGLTASFSAVGLVRKIREYPKNHIYEDTFYFVCRAINPAGTLELSNTHGDNFWMTIAEAEKAITSNITFSPISQRLIREAYSVDPSHFFFFNEHLLLPRV